MSMLEMQERLAEAKDLERLRGEVKRLRRELGAAKADAEMWRQSYDRLAVSAMPADALARWHMNANLAARLGGLYAIGRPAC